jgi:hypothetical protein
MIPGSPGPSLGGHIGRMLRREEPDATNVRVPPLDESSRKYTQLLQALKTIPESDPRVEAQVGGRGYLDTLGAVVGAQPTKISQKTDQPESWGQFDRDEQAIFMRYSPRPLDSRRGVMAHEYGHLLEQSDPDVYDEYKRRRGSPLPKTWREKAEGRPSFYAETNEPEAFAEAFGHAVAKRAPEVTGQTAYADFYGGLVRATKGQQEYLDSLVNARFPKKQ